MILHDQGVPRMCHRLPGVTSKHGAGKDPRFRNDALLSGGQWLTQYRLQETGVVEPLGWNWRAAMARWRAWAWLRAMRREVRICCCW